ncbi:MAG: hypothetical protein HXY22_06565 [Alphaproteobacteria bacterium]|nr:hypothetical protein [Alphaproteobacteria bacterium]
MPELFSVYVMAVTETHPMTETIGWVLLLMTGLVIGNFATSVLGLLLRPANGRNSFLALALTWPFLALAAMSALAYALSTLA